MAQTNETEARVPEAGNTCSPPKPGIILVDDGVDVRIAGHAALLAKGEVIAADCKPVEPPPGLDFGELGHTEEVAQAIEKANKDIEEHVPQRLPHFQRKKAHPHKRSISSENRRALVAGGNAWWLKGK